MSISIVFCSHILMISMGMLFCAVKGFELDQTYRLIRSVSIGSLIVLEVLTTLSGAPIVINIALLLVNLIITILTLKFIQQSERLS